MPRQLELVTTAFTAGQIPALDQAQVALAGRSNVGKSSLVNRLAGRRRLARTSATPGKTRSLNFFRVDPDGFYLVDLPGYGYARCSKAERESWGRLIEHYLNSAQALCAVVLLVDARLQPQKLDLELLAFVQSRRIPVQVVLTKADKCKQADLAKRRKEWLALAPGSAPLPFSSVTGLGRDELWRRLARAAAPEAEAAGPDAAPEPGDGPGV
ncbi:MAG: ribosome biogenesis GTP-binding protein YihA/YsxC [Desulfovibrionaceae bacterium]